MLGSGISPGGSILLFIDTDDTSDNIAGTIANKYEQVIQYACAVSLLLTCAAFIVTDSIIMSKIKSARSLALGETADLDISPAILMGHENSIYPGFSVSIRF